MKSLILTIAYLWKDTWSRWFEQPGSPLAKGVVVAILSTLSAFLLIGFYLQEKTILNKIEALGANTIVLKDTSAQSQGSGGGSTTLKRLFQDLDPYGECIFIKMIPIVAKDSFNGVLPVITSEELEKKYTPTFVLFSNTKPKNASVRLRLQNNYIDAIVLQSPDWIQASGFNEVLLIPKTWEKYYNNLGTADWLIFRDLSNQFPSLETIVSSIQKLKKSENLRALQIISPLKLRKELQKWQEKAKLWKQALIASLAVVIALICGTISVLEFRQNLYIYSLMRSFGISNILLYLRAFADSFMIANLFSILVLFSVYSLSEFVFGNFGFSKLLINESINHPNLWFETAQILVGVNLGVLFGSFPIYIALKKPIGLVLN